MNIFFWCSLGVVLGVIAGLRSHVPSHSPSRRVLKGSDVHEYYIRRIDKCVSELERHVMDKMDTYTLDRLPWIMHAYSTPGLNNLTEQAEREECLIEFTERISDHVIRFKAEREVGLFVNKCTYRISRLQN